MRVKFGFIIIRKRYFKISKMAYKLPELPYAKDSFGGILSPETFDYHYGKHHQTYITNLNNLIKGTEWENKTLDDIVSGYDFGLFQMQGSKNLQQRRSTLEPHFLLVLYDPRAKRANWRLEGCYCRKMGQRSEVPRRLQRSSCCKFRIRLDLARQAGQRHCHRKHIKRWQPTDQQLPTFVDS